MTVDRHLLLARPLEPQGRGWLAVDLLAGDRVWNLTGVGTAPTGAPGAVLVAGTGEIWETLAGGGLRVSEDLLWSLLTPGDAGREIEPLPDDEDAAAAALRTERRRFLAGWRQWSARDSSLRDGCRQLLHGRRPDLTPLLDILDGEPPPGGEEPAAPAEQAPPATVTVPDFAAEAVAGWLVDEEGLGALYGENFTPRPEQATMGRVVTSALAAGEPLLLEAGTGVGKTLAYLAPLVASIVGRGTRAVIATHTRALQHQLLEQDLPRLAPLLRDHRSALLMGRRNYLCLRQRQSYLTRPCEDLGDALRLVAFRLWLADTRAGLREELVDHPLLKRDLAELFDGPEPCLPGACYEGGRCFVQGARRRAREADLVVVNHALLMHDLAAGGTLVGDHDHLVVDEAHRLPAAALDVHAVVCGLRRSEEITRLVGPAHGAGVPERAVLAAGRLAAPGSDEALAAAGACEDFGRVLLRAVDAYGQWWRALGRTVDSVLPASGRPRGRQRVAHKTEAFAPVREETAHLLEELALTAENFARLASATADLPTTGSGVEDDLAVLGQAGQLVRDLHRDVRFLMVDPAEDWVTWLESAPRRGLRLLGATPLEAGRLLRDHWLDTACRPVMTSATLAVGEDFSHMLGELGLTRRRPPTRTALVPSPFDYDVQTLALVPTRFAAPEAPDFGRAVGELLRDLVLATDRKTLALFTSYRAIGEAADVLAAAGFGPRPGSAPALLVQEPGGATGSLLARFRRLSRAVLLGTATFWEGVDFPGEDLEILVVAKLPFLVPNDPWVQARCERLQAAGENPFTAFMVRDAVLRLRQGCGRLIRRLDDRGVVVVLDTRLHTRSYGSTFLGALPTMPVGCGDTGDLLARARRFLAGD